MIPTLGHAAVIGGLAASVFSVAAFAIAGRRHDPALAGYGRRGMAVAFGMAVVAATSMIVSLLAHDFSVEYVRANNATTTPPFYSVISLWAALEGSILFWTVLATGWAALVLHRFRHRSFELMPWAGLCLALGATFFFAVMAWPGDPFARTAPVAADGNGPNALLQNHPFMGLHPPLLYLGYTGMAVPFAFGMAALISGRTDETWLGIVRRWTLIPWIFLSAGIVAGAWWSYEVLGWGGYWFWDPVENAALMPWLTATAFLHSSMVAERRGTLRTWTHLLVLLTFWLTLLGTFLTRTGVVFSVHSFTESQIGAWFLAALVITLVGGLSLLVWRLPELGDRRPLGRPISRESAFLFNNLLFVVLTFAVVFGTLYPLLAQAVSGASVSLGSPWFNRVNAPIFLALLFLMGVGPALPWGGAGWSTVRERFAVPVLAGVALAVGGWALGAGAAAVVTLALAGFVVTVMADEVVRGARARSRARGEGAVTAALRLATHHRRRYGGYVVHAGIAVMAVAVAISATLGSETTATLRPGESIGLDGYTVTYERLVVEPLPADPRVTETRAELRLAGPQAGSLAAALRDYPNSVESIATPGVRSGVGEDLYVTLLAADPESQSVTLGIHRNPLVSWIWLGGGIVAGGGIFAAWPERRRAAVSTPMPASIRPVPVRSAPEAEAAVEPGLPEAGA